MPQRTFRGRVTTIGEVPDESGFPVRAAVPTPDGLLRPGMDAYARVLTDPASVVQRAFRAPARWLRLFWWRVTP